MRIKLQFGLSIFIFIFCQGCEKIFNFPEKGKSEKITVVEAIITDKLDHQKIRVSFSSQFDDSLSSEPIANALVKIVDGTTDTIRFKYLENGWYTNNSWVALAEKEYKLLVQIDTTIYQAISKIVPANGLDSLSYSFKKNSNNQDSTPYLKIYAGRTDPINPKYYQVQIYKNQKLITTGNNAELFSDEATISLNGVEILTDFTKGDTLDVELYSLNKTMFDYYVYIFNKLLYNNSNDLEYKTNPSTQFKPKAMGYFQISSLSSKRIIIK